MQQDASFAVTPEFTTARSNSVLRLAGQQGGSSFEDEYELDGDGLEDLRRRRLELQTRELELKVEALEAAAEVNASLQYNNRTIHFVDAVEYRSTSKAITQLAEMARQSLEPIEIIFHSPGGDIFSGFALYDYIQLVKEQGIKVTTVVLGGAFSMAGILLQAGTHRVITPHSWMMIHEAGSSVEYGTSSAIKDQSELLRRLEEDGNSVLAERSTLTVDEIKERCHRKNWFLNAEETLRYGFVDEIRPAPPAVPIARAAAKRVRRVKAAA